MERLPFLLEIDGQAVEYTDFNHKETRTFPAYGGMVGLNETTQPGDQVRNFKVNGSVFALSVYRRNPDGSFWGIDGLFARGEWAGDENQPIYRVWDRIV